MSFCPITFDRELKKKKKKGYTKENIFFGVLTFLIFLGFFFFSVKKRVGPTTSAG
jgi:hypothetical protein